MARRRMFSLDVIDNDLFQDMPKTAKYLYFELGLRSDDDGFIGNVKRILRMTGSDDDLKILIAKGYIFKFETGVIVIRDWKINNQIRADRYKTTVFQNELESLLLLPNNQYTVEICPSNQMATIDIPNVTPAVTTGKVSIDYKKHNTTNIVNTNIDLAAAKTVGTVDNSTVDEIINALPAGHVVRIDLERKYKNKEG